MKALAVQLDHLSRTRGDTADLGNEDALVERAKTNPEAFGQLFELYYEKILTYVFRCTLNFAVAEELTSNTFLKALRGLPKYRGRHQLGFSRWLYRIATNEIGMHWRRERRRHKVLLASDSPGVLERTCFDAAGVDNEEAHREKMHTFMCLHEAVSKLPERYRSVIVLRFFEELRYEEIGDVMGKRIGTVKSLIHRGVRRLRSVLEQDATFAHWPH